MQRFRSRNTTRARFISHRTTEAVYVLCAYVSCETVNCNQSTFKLALAYQPVGSICQLARERHVTRIQLNNELEKSEQFLKGVLVVYLTLFESKEPESCGETAECWPIDVGDG